MRKSRKIWAVTAAVLMLLTVFPATALAGEESGTIGGDSEVNDVIISVVVPSTLNFALDPLELDSLDGSQVSTADYFFVNKTEAPVKVAMTITATLKEDVSLVDDPLALAQDDPSVTEKALYFAALGATGVTANSLSFGYDFDEPEEEDVAPVGAYSIDAKTRVPFSAATKDATIMFALAKATDEIKVIPAEGEDPETTEEGQDGVMDTLALEDKGVATFQFFGLLNTYAAWDDNDITVSGAYTLTALRATTYANYATNGSYVTGGLNQLKSVIGFTDAGGTLFNSKEYTYSKSSVPAGGLSVGFSLAGKPITSFKDADNNALVAGTDYEIGTGENIDKIILKPALLSSLATGAQDLVLVVNGVNYTLNITPVYDSIGFIDAGGTATSSKTYTFNKSEVPADITVGFYFGGQPITSFKDASGNTLAAGTAYTVGTDSFVLKAGVLGPLTSGDKEFSIVVNGVTHKLNVEVIYDEIGFIDVGGTAASSKTYTFNKSEDPEDITVGFYFGGESITSVKDADDNALVAETDYAVGADSFVLKSGALSPLTSGDKEFSIVVDGETYTLNVEVVYDEIGFLDAGGTAISSKMYTYDKDEIPEDGIKVGFYFGGEAITSFKDADDNALVAGTDYTLADDALVLTPALLAALDAGEQALTLTVDGTEYALNLTVTEPETGFDSTGFIVDDATQTTLALGNITKAGAADLLVPFYFDDLTITSLTVNTVPRTAISEYTKQGDNLVLRAALFEALNPNAKTVVITLSDSSTYTLTFTLV